MNTDSVQTIKNISFIAFNELVKNKKYVIKVGAGSLADFVYWTSRGTSPKLSDAQKYQDKFKDKEFFNELSKDGFQVEFI